jgi:hypothetical protein
VRLSEGREREAGCRPTFDPRAGEGGVDLWVPVVKK